MRAHCIALSACWLLACGADQVGARCSEMLPCAATLVCTATETAGVTVCMSSCDDPSARLCADGTVCAGADGARVCYLGGRTPYSSACVDDAQCEAGTVCSPDLGRCEQACAPADPRACPAGDICMNVGGGICRRDLRSGCADDQPCAASGRCSPDLMICEPSCAECDDESICTEVGDGFCRRVLGAKCSELYPCTTGLTCTPDPTMGASFCVSVE